MRIFTELLFQHGHIADVALARQLAEADTAVEAKAKAEAEVEVEAGTGTGTEIEAEIEAQAEAAGQTARRAPVASAATPQQRAEHRMARRARRLVRAMTALSPFR
ncbi:MULTISPECIES: hypothetical protein [unclassified Xanthomonas]|uniref:hypothetical protein n=1 Tax=unclassified Xanthomonas TaxID=2643310 RepID=UPI00288322E6|nr:MULTISPECIES: hypothetical protein [unclassified Xanthomonas]